MKASAIIVPLALACSSAGAGPLAVPSAPHAEFTQNIGVMLPLQERFVDDDGAPVSLEHLIGGHSTLLLFGYYRCPMLCSIVAAGALEALDRAHLADDAVNVVEIGIDPRETPADAVQRKDDYRRRFGALAGRVHLLTGTASAIDAVAAAGGFHYSYDAAQAQYVHPAGFLVVTPQGRISRYFLGVRFDARDLGKAIDDADRGHTGSVLERLILLCAHFDPSVGRHSLAVMTMVRIACIGICALLSLWIWRRRRARRTDA